MPAAIAYNVNRTTFEKNCLIDYTEKPFLYQIRMESHQNMRQSIALARIVGGFGYNVDVRDYTKKSVMPDNTYDLIIDIHPDAPDTYRPLMRAGCKRIAYLTTSNPSFNNDAEQRRIDDLNKRRGLSLSPVRHYAEIDREVENYDAFFVIGNRKTLATFTEAFSLPPTFLIRNNGYDFDFPFDPAKKNPRAFLFLGGPGQVHKGLDLLLEIFGKRDDLFLFVLSDTQAEPAFDLAFGKELYQRDNIFPLGFTDVHGELFRETVSYCCHGVFPSCAEGCSGSVLTAMSAGVIPVASAFCGLDDDEALVLPDCRPDAIEAYLDERAALPLETLRADSARYQDIARTRYSFSAFQDSVTGALRHVLEETL